jgi:hypothetical protein
MSTEKTLSELQTEANELYTRLQALSRDLDMYSMNDDLTGDQSNLAYHAFEAAEGAAKATGEALRLLEAIE